MVDRPQKCTQLEADQAKARFLEAAREADPLDPIRRHPWRTLGGSVAAGFLLGRIGFLPRLPSSFLPGVGFLVPSLSRLLARRTTRRRTDGSG